MRRNHALEHATLHVLAREIPSLNLVGRSDGEGFMLYGDIDGESIHCAVREAYARLQRGEGNLSVHPNCGTNLAVGIVLAGAAYAVGMLSGLNGQRRRWRWPLTILGMAGAMVLSRPLGPEVQRRWTTDPDMTGVSIGQVTCLSNGRIPVHRVEIEHTS